MNDTLYLIDMVLNISFTLIFIFMFYYSIRKCFLKNSDRHDRIKLFFITLATNPYIIFAVFVFLAYIVAIIFLLATGHVSAELNTLATNSSFLAVLMSIFGVLYTPMIILFSRLIGKKLKVKNVSLVTFVYLIFSVITGLSDDPVTFSSILQYIVSILNHILLIIATLLIYHLIIKELAKLSDTEIVTRWKIFTIPPAIFLLFYFPISYSLYAYAGYETFLASQVFSMVVLFLFIWAFYVIINNINATNEAIVAKNETKNLSVEVMEALANTIDAKDKYTNGHSIRVAKYSRMISAKMGLDEETCENIYYMGLLHDIGKIGVPNEIINKPSRLNDEEYEIIKTHPVIGYEILSKIKSKPELLKGARWHHERFDGKGYPDGLSGEDIPLEARIIAVADAYDAMTSNRSYRKYLPQDVVREEIKKNLGTQFDSEIAKYMLELIDEDTEYNLHE